MEMDLPAVGYLDGAGVACSAVVGSGGRTSALRGAIGVLQHRYFQQWKESTDEETAK